ncbi:MAG: hypothetical protein ACJ8CB_30280 [Ktedonobacteraceae bacterium]
MVLAPVHRTRHGRRCGHCLYQFFALQSALAAQIVIPPSLLLALLILVCICGITLVAMVRIVTLPLLNQTLRLNED